MSLPIKTCAPYAWPFAGQDAAHPGATHPDVRPIWLAPIGNCDSAFAPPQWRYYSTPSLWQGPRSKAKRPQNMRSRPFRELILFEIIFQALAWFRIPARPLAFSRSFNSARSFDSRIGDGQWRAQLEWPCATVAHHLREIRSEIISLRDRILRRHQRNQSPAYRLQRRLLRHAFCQLGSSDGASGLPAI